MTVPIKEWTHGVQVEEQARRQLEATASLPIVWAAPCGHAGRCDRKSSGISCDL